MKLTENVYVVGGGRFGFGISGILDCHVYLIKDGSECALIDAGLGLAGDFDKILDNIRSDGIDPKTIRKLIATHYHADHIGAAQEARQRLELEVLTSKLAAPVMREANEQAIALDVAKAAGFYPQDYHLSPCEVDRELAEGDVIEVGDLALRVWETPGHCDGHLSFDFQGSDRKYLIGPL